MATHTKKIIAHLVSAGADKDTACRLAGKIASQKSKNDAMHQLNGTGFSSVKNKISKECDKMYA